MMKMKTPDMSTKNQILQWINSTLNTNQTKIQSLGNGIVYCLLMNNFYPNSIPKHKIVMVPRNSMDNKTNLRKVQEVLQAYNIKSINFDIFRVSEMSYLDNWQLINKLYKHFQENFKYDQQQQQKTYSNQNQSVHNVAIQNNTQMNYGQQQFTLPKQISKTPDFGTGLLTPMKGLKFFDQNTKLRVEALRLMQEIKMIVKSQGESDRVKVKNLKKMLGLIQQENQQQEWEMKELFSDCKKKQEVITID